MKSTVQVARERPACTTFNDTPQCLKQCTGTKIRNAVVGINISGISLKVTSKELHMDKRHTKILTTASWFIPGA